MFEKAVKTKKECPVCGKMHTLVEHPHQLVWLDGHPQLPMSEFLEQYAMCSECGCVYGVDASESTAMTQLVRSEHYQALRQADCDTPLKKLLCMNEYQWGFGNIPLLLAHYYDEIGDHDKTNDALRQAADAIGSSRFSDTRTIYTGETRQFKIIQSLMLQPELYLVDIYRRAGQFESAVNKIAELRARTYFGKPTNIMNYLACEEDLIKAKDTQRR